jgi:hypothetical protein
MTKVLALLLAIAAAAPALAQSSTHVQGYMRSDGTYVQPHYRSTPDSSRYNNYSAQGNYNPYTGQTGTRDPNRSTNSLTGSTRPSWDRSRGY